MKKYFKQLGQGMTEYIIIVALIAIAAIAVYSFFGDTVRGQMGAMTLELGGQDGTAVQATATAQATKAGNAAASGSKQLSNFSGSAVQK
jgi:Flp pilus assembly pilin Flp